jgi:hypothetical protein
MQATREARLPPVSTRSRIGGELRWLGALAAVSITLADCAPDMDEKAAGQPCTRSEQCAGPLRCSQGTCVPRIKSSGAGHAASEDEDAGTGNSLRE